MTPLSVEQVDREPYDDIYWGADPNGNWVELSRAPAPIEGFYEVTVEVGGDRRIFDMEVRTGRGGTPQIEVSDEGIGDYLSDRGLTDPGWDAVCNAVFAVHDGEPPELPLDLRSPSSRS